MSTPSRPAPRSAAAKYDGLLQSYALGYPEAVEEAPWGHRAIKVRGKTFLFLVADADGLSLSVKLPHSGPQALTAPFCEPTGYGLGRSGWVTARFGMDETPPVEDLRTWIDESYRAIAPKRLIKVLDEPKPEPRPAPARPRKKTRRKAATRPSRKA